VVELFGWNVGMSALAALLLVAGALLIGVVAHYIGEAAVSWEWAATGAAALVGGYLGSESFGSVSTSGPVFEGLYVLSAVIGGLVLGGVVDALVRYSMQGSYARHARPI
jgi:hypothetical protein